MKKTSKLKNLISKSAAAMLCLCLAAGILTSCSGGEESGVKTTKSVVSLNSVANPSVAADLHFTDTASLADTGITSGLIGLAIDEKTGSFGIKLTSSQQVWSALPLRDEIPEGKSPAINASVVSLKIIGGTEIFYRNSQDNSVAYGTSQITTTPTGADFVYNIFTDEETAKKTAFDKTDIGFRVTVKVELVDGSANVSCTHENITGNPDAFIESLDLLNSFGAYMLSSEDDFLLVPDGSGAIIKTAVYDESFEPLSFAVYGNDPSQLSEESSAAIIPAFGMKHNGIAFVSLIQKGDAAATIKAQKATGISEYNLIYPSFSVTPVHYENETLYVSKGTASDEISLCYRFLTGNNATYAGLASACREQLIRNSVLSTKNVETTNYLPFCLTLTGATTKSVGPFSYLSTLTTFEQANDMLIRMRNKGINNIGIRYTGVFSGGTDSKDISNAKILSRLGGTEKLGELYEYAAAQKMNLYLDVNILSSATDFSGTNAMSINKSDSSYTPVSAVAEYMEEQPAERKLRSLNKLSKLVAGILSDTRYYGFSGFCLNDVGSVLYSDFSSGGMLRDTAADTVAKAIAPLSTGHSTMAVGGNFYMLKNIGTVINVPLKATASQSGAYFTVPFVQLVLHGIVDYAGNPINTEVNLEETLLKNIEFGACPHFEWNYEPVTDHTDSDIFYYDNTINAAAEYYVQANEALNDLRDARMTDHYEVDDGVFCTEYDTGSMIYVNYTDNDYSTLGVVVEARSFLRVN